MSFLMLEDILIAIFIRHRYPERLVKVDILLVYVYIKMTGMRGCLGSNQGIDRDRLKIMCYKPKCCKWKG